MNNTVFGNAASIEGGGVRHYSTTLRPELINTIFWADTPGEILITGGALLVEYCNVQGGHAAAPETSTATPCSRTRRTETFT